MVRQFTEDVQKFHKIRNDGQCLVENDDFALELIIKIINAMSMNNMNKYDLYIVNEP